MDAQVQPHPSNPSVDRPQADDTWDEHYRDERDAAYLYRALAAVETDAAAS